MKTELQRIAAVVQGQVHGLPLPGGIVLDADGNKYPSQSAKLIFLKQCFDARLRSGNLQRITTINQLSDLVARINRTAAAVGAPVLDSEAVVLAQTEISAG
jgi:hypothetical protein